MEKLELKMDRMDREAKELRKKLKRDVEGEMEDRLKEIEREFIKKQEAEIKGIRRELENVNKDREDGGEGDREETRKQMEIMKKEIVKEGMNEIKKERAQEGKQVEALATKLEELERERRKKNIVIFNLRESEKEEAEQRYSEDLKMCGEIFAGEMGPDGHAGYEGREAYKNWKKSWKQTTLAG